MLSVVTSLLAGWWLERVKPELVLDDAAWPTPITTAAA
jgi:hypothetical protein